MGPRRATSRKRGAKSPSRAAEVFSPRAKAERARAKSPLAERVILANMYVGNPLGLSGASLDCGQKNHLMDADTVSAFATLHDPLASFDEQDAAAELIVVKADRDERIASKMSDRCYLATCSCCTCCTCSWMLLIVLLLLFPTLFRSYVDSVLRMSEPFRWCASNRFGWPPVSHVTAFRFHLVSQLWCVSAQVQMTLSTHHRTSRSRHRRWRHRVRLRRCHDRWAIAALARQLIRARQLQ